MGALVLADLLAHVHPGSEGVEEVLVDDVDLRTELVDALAVILVHGVLLTDLQAFQQGEQVRWCELLLRIGKGHGRVAVGLDHEALQAQVHRLLGQFQQIFPAG